MNLYSNLMAEVEDVQRARTCGVLEAIEYILDNESYYTSEVRRELRLFMRDGAKLFAPKKETGNENA